MNVTGPQSPDLGPPQWIMNPYRIAELLLDKPLGGANAHGFLVEAFQTKVERLFDPEPDAPTLLDNLRDPRILNRTWDTVAECIGSLRRSTDTRNAGLSDEKLARVVPWLLDVKEPLPRPPGAGSGPEPVRKKVVGSVMFDQLSFLDPRQGAVADCFLIAAMIAIAWTLPVQWKKRVTGARPTEAEPGFHRWRFGTPSGEATVQVDADVWVDARGVPVYASSVDADEQWPGVVEKAFVMLRNEAAPRVDPKPPAYQHVGGRLAEWPHEAAARLLGLKPERTELVATSQPGARPLSTHIDARLEPDSTTVPIMASTWRKEKLTKLSNDPDSEVRDTAKEALELFKPTRTAVTMNHALAVLGRLDRGGKQFVVLRDPHSVDHPEREFCAEGVWRPRSERHGVAEVKLHQHGVFALERKIFDQLFFAVSWVEPPQS